MKTRGLFNFQSHIITKTLTFCKNQLKLLLLYLTYQLQFSNEINYTKMTKVITVVTVALFSIGLTAQETKPVKKEKAKKETCCKKTTDKKDKKSCCVKK